MQDAQATVTTLDYHLWAAETQGKVLNRREMWLASGLKATMLDTGWKVARPWAWVSNGSIWEMGRQVITIATTQRGRNGGRNGGGNGGH